MTTLPEIALTATAVSEGMVSVLLSSIQAVDATAVGPGEIAGPSLAVTVNITNRSDAAISIDTVIVTLEDSAGSPGLPTTSAPARPFTGNLAPGESADGVYVFTISQSVRNPVSVLVSYSTEAPVVRFVGDAA